jgi:hypothetical protein
MKETLTSFIEESLANQWQPNKPAPANLYQSDWPWFPIPFSADFEKMHRECLDNDHMFVGHRQKDRQFSYNHEGWAAITLHGISPTATENYEQYGFNSLEESNYHWTEACDVFPTCAEFIKSLGYELYERVRIMKLHTGGYIMPHTDGAGRLFGPLNIAINNPDNCNFYFRKWGCVPFKQGQGFLLDIGNEHIVWNQSNENRYHFIVHGSGNQRLKKQALERFNNA